MGGSCTHLDHPHKYVVIHCFRVRNPVAFLVLVHRVNQVGFKICRFLLQIFFICFDFRVVVSASKNDNFLFL